MVDALLFTGYLLVLRLVDSVVSEPCDEPLVAVACLSCTEVWWGMVRVINLYVH